MKSVGVKVLKNHLSQYLKLVRSGEIVLVTDRDEVIAEIRLPSESVVTRASPWIAFLEEQARRGAVRLASRKRSSLVAATRPLTNADIQETLDRAREERF